MSKFRPFDYLTESEQKEVIKYEYLLQACKTVSEYLEVERILNDYRDLGIARRQLEDLKEEYKKLDLLKETNKKWIPFDYFTEDEKSQVLMYEELLKSSKSVGEYLQFNKILDEYLELARVRKRINELQNELGLVDV